MDTRQDQQGLSRLDQLRGMRRWNVSGAFAAVHSAITTGAYSTGYALHLGASEALIGLLTAAPAWGQLLQMLSPLLIERLKRRKPFALATYALGYSVWLPIALIPFFFLGGARPWAMIVLVGLAGATLALGSPASTSWLTDLVPAAVRGRFIARQQSILAAVALVASLTAGWYIDLFPDQTKQTGFLVLFSVAVVFALLSIVVWATVPEPPRREGRPPSMADVLTLPLRNANFRRLTVFVCARTMAVMVAGPFFTVYMLKNLGVPYAQIAILAGLSTVSSIVANPLWGYLADKYGHKPILSISSLGIALVPLWWFFATKGNYLIVVSAVQVYAGVLSPGVLLSQFNLMVKIAPEQNRSAYVGFHSAAVNLASSLGAILGGLLANLYGGLPDVLLFGRPVAHLQSVFLTSCSLRLLAWPLLAAVREEKEVPARVVLDRLRSRQPVTTLWNLMRMLRSSDPATKVQAARSLGATGSSLAVEELIALLDDSDRQVRREAARALGEIGDPRAVAPLIDKLRDPTADIVEEAVEALGRIPTGRSLESLTQMLSDERPSVRKSAVVALAELGDPRAREPVETMIEVERDPTVFVAAAHALSRIGGRRVLHILRRLLRRSSPGVGRKELASSLGHLLGPPGAFYRLLEAEPMTQEAMVARALSGARRRLARALAADPEGRAYVEDNCSAGLQYFARERYAEAVACVHALAAASVRSFAASEKADALLQAYTGEPPTSLTPAQRVGLLLRENEHLRINLGFLAGLHSDGRRQELHREEALLAIFAYQQVMDALAELERASGRLTRSPEGRQV